MTIYLFLFLIILFPALIELGYNKPIKNRKIILFGYFIFLILFVGLRRIGYDYDSYQELYTNVKKGIESEAMDRGFKFLCSIAPSFRVLLVLMACFTLIPLYKVITLKSEYYFLSLLLFISTFLLPTVMGQMRQGVAIFVMLYAYYFWKDNQAIYIGIWILCCAIHTSALIAVVLLFPIKKIFPVYLYLLGIIGAIILSKVLASVFAPYLNTLSLIQDTNVSDRLNYYNTTETNAGVAVGFNTAVLLRCIILLFYYKLLKKYKDNNGSVLNLYYLSIIIYLSLGFMPQLAGRGSQYFVVFDIILIPLIIKENRGWLRSSLIIGFILISLLRYIQFFGDSFNRHSYLPYTFAI